MSNMQFKIKVFRFTNKTSDEINIDLEKWIENESPIIHSIDTTSHGRMDSYFYITIKYHD